MSQPQKRFVPVRPDDITMPQVWRPWLCPDDYYLRQNYANLPTKLVMAYLSRTEWAVRDRASRLGLKKPIRQRICPCGTILSPQNTDKGDWYGHPQRTPNGAIKLARRNWCSRCRRDYERPRRKALYRKQRAIVYEHYGNRCNCEGCTETNLEFLTIHHLNGDGQIHRAKLGNRSGAMYRWLIKNNFPTSFTVLCINCNWARGIHGFCPHETNPQGPRTERFTKGALRRHSLRGNVYAHYGNVCSCKGCGERNWHFFSMHHLMGNGRIHRAQIGSSAGRLHRWLIENDFPTSFSLLCMNCNHSLRMYGYCPHSSKAGNAS